MISAILSGVLLGLVFLIVLSILVLIHEFGHFITAKKLGIKVEEFGFGFPPRVWGWKKGETLYSINLLPIGGFVKLYGEDEVGGGKLTVSNKTSGEGSKRDIKRAFFARPTWQRALIVVAGVIMNVLLAIVIFYAFLGISNFKTELPLLDPNYQFAGVTQKNYNLEKSEVISVIAQNSPAEKAGMRAPLQITQVDSLQNPEPKKFIEYVNNHKGKEITVSWKEMKSGESMTAKITPRISPPKNEGPLGVGFYPVALLSYETASQKFFSGFTHPYNLMSYNLAIMKQLFAYSIEKKTVAPVSEGFSGPIGIAVLFGSILSISNVTDKVLQLLNLAGILSISLAFFNILPIPALDGGRLFFILVEMVSGKKVNQRFESLAHAVGFALLMALFVLITFKDISQFILHK